MSVRLTVGKVADGQLDCQLLPCDHERGGFCRSDASGPSPVKCLRTTYPNGLSTDEAERVLTQELSFRKILNEQLRAQESVKDC